MEPSAVDAPRVRATVITTLFGLCAPFFATADVSTLVAVCKTMADEPTFAALLKRDVACPRVDVTIEQLLAGASVNRQYADEAVLALQSASEIFQLADHTAGQVGEIVRDIGRTFPGHPFFAQGRARAGWGDDDSPDVAGPLDPWSFPGQYGLMRVLIGFLTARPGVGYAQGMNYVAAAALILASEPVRTRVEGGPASPAPAARVARHRSPEQSLADVLALLLAFSDRYGCADLWRPELPRLPYYGYALSDCTRRHVPLLHEHLTRIGFSFDVFAAQWLLPLCSTMLPVRTLRSVWRAFIANGWKALIRVCVAILGRLQPRIVDGDMDVGEVSVLLREWKDCIGQAGRYSPGAAASASGSPRTMPPSPGYSGGSSESASRASLLTRYPELDILFDARALLSAGARIKITRSQLDALEEAFAGRVLEAAVDATLAASSVGASGESGLTTVMTPHAQATLLVGLRAVTQPEALQRMRCMHKLRHAAAEQAGAGAARDVRSSSAVSYAAILALHAPSSTGVASARWLTALSAALSAALANPGAHVDNGLAGLFQMGSPQRSRRIFGGSMPSPGSARRAVEFILSGRLVSPLATDAEGRPEGPVQAAPIRSPPGEILRRATRAGSSAAVGSIVPRVPSSSSIASIISSAADSPAASTQVAHAAPMTMALLPDVAGLDLAALTQLAPLNGSSRPIGPTRLDQSPLYRIVMRAIASDAALIDAECWADAALLTAKSSAAREKAAAASAGARAAAALQQVAETELQALLAKKKSLSTQLLAAVLGGGMQPTTASTTAGLRSPMAKAPTLPASPGGAQRPGTIARAAPPTPATPAASTGAPAVEQGSIAPSPSSLPAGGAAMDMSKTSSALAALDASLAEAGAAWKAACWQATLSATRSEELTAAADALMRTLVEAVDSGRARRTALMVQAWRTLEQAWKVFVGPMRVSRDAWALHGAAL